MHASAISVAATISMAPSKARSLSQTEENQARFPQKFHWSLMVGQAEEFSVYLSKKGFNFATSLGFSFPSFPQKIS